MTTFSYDDTGHAYRLNGQPIPSATQIIGLLDKPFLAPGAVKATVAHIVKNIDEVAADVADNAFQAERNLKGVYREKWNAKRDIGSIVHEAIETWVTTGTAIGLPDEARPFFAAFLEFVEDHDPQWIKDGQRTLVEQAICSERHGYAGTFDAMADVMGSRLIIDFKTGSRVNPEDVALQLAAYRYADFIAVLDERGNLTERRPVPPVDGAAVLHLRPGRNRKGHYELWEVSADDFVYDEFLKLRSVYRFVCRGEELKIGTIAETERKTAA